MTKARINPDLLNNAKAQQVAEASLSVIDALQTFPPHTQPLALCAAFLKVCQKYGLPAQDMFATTKNLLDGAAQSLEARRAFAALCDYVEFEL